MSKLWCCSDPSTVEAVLVTGGFQRLISKEENHGALIGTDLTKARKKITRLGYRTTTRTQGNCERERGGRCEVVNSGLRFVYSKKKPIVGVVFYYISRNQIGNSWCSIHSERVPK